MREVVSETAGLSSGVSVVAWWATVIADSETLKAGSEKNVNKSVNDATHITGLRLIKHFCISLTCLA